MLKFVFFTIFLLPCCCGFLCSRQPQPTTIRGVSRGFFSSDINPLTGSYYTWQRCTWNITVRPHYRIRFYFTDLDLVPTYLYKAPNSSILPFGEPCGCDRVSIYQSYQPSRYNIVESLCGEIGIPRRAITTSSNEAIVQFCTDFSHNTIRNYRGFTLHFVEIPTNEENESKETSSYPKITTVTMTEPTVAGEIDRQPRKPVKPLGSIVSSIEIPSTEPPPFCISKFDTGAVVCGLM